MVSCMSNIWSGGYCSGAEERRNLANCVLLPPADCGRGEGLPPSRLRPPVLPLGRSRRPADASKPASPRPCRAGQARGPAQRVPPPQQRGLCGALHSRPSLCEPRLAGKRRLPAPKADGLASRAACIGTESQRGGLAAPCSQSCAQACSGCGGTGRATERRHHRGACRPLPTRRYFRSRAQQRRWPVRTAMTTQATGQGLPATLCLRRWREGTPGPAASSPAPPASCARPCRRPRRPLARFADPPRTPRSQGPRRRAFRPTAPAVALGRRAAGPAASPRLGARRGCDCPAAALP